MIRFDEKQHKYYDGDKELISVTTLLGKQGLGVDYGNVDAETLHKAAERGTAIHEEIENFIKNGELGWSEEFNNFKAWFDANVVEVLGSEEIVHNDIVAGTYDFFAILKNGRKTRIDFKTTYEFHKFSTAWQLCVYDYLDTNKAEDFAGIWLRNDKFEFIPLDRVPKEEIERLMECERNGLIYVEDTDLKAKSEELKALLSKKDKIEEQINNLKDELNKKVKMLGSYKNGNLTISYVPASTKKSFDSKSFEQDHKKLYAKYLKVSVTNESYRYTLKEEKTND